jgi:hypothetical protein
MKHGGNARESGPGHTAAMENDLYNDVPLGVECAWPGDALPWTLHELDRLGDLASVHSARAHGDDDRDR